MKHLISLLAFSFLIGCDAEKSNKTKPPEAISVSPNLKYEIKGDAVAITRCDKKASGELIIPANIEGKPVTEIGTFAFSSCYGLTSITIPDSVTSIGDDAFARCASLTSITIPDSVTSIESTFSLCVSLTSITIPDSVTSIGEMTFLRCNSLKNITIGNGVTSIGVYAFLRCTSLTSITIPDSVTSIDKQAFKGCNSLTALTFLGDAPEIANDAFEQSSPTIYRKADAKGWGDTLADRPVKLISEKP